MPHTIPGASRLPTVTEHHPPEPPATGTPGQHPQPATGTPGQHPQPALQAHDLDEGSGTGLSEPSGPGEVRRSRLSWINANTVIGALIGIIGMIIVAVLTAGVVVINAKFDDINTRFDDINTRFDDINARFDDMFAYFNGRFDEMNGRLTAVEDEVKGLRQDINHTNTRLDVLISVLEVNQTIPIDIVPKSTSPPLLP